MNARGYYGQPRVGQALPRSPTVYVEREGASTGAWILGIFGGLGVVLWARHQSRQLEQLYKTTGLPYQTFAGDLRESAKALPSRVRGVAARVLSARPLSALPEQPTLQREDTQVI